ncbi:MAG: hypothetical protein MRY63_11220 [Neomegalonema sp.]|nr:hypothetical protein [Neomegalonema sp.]
MKNAANGSETMFYGMNAWFLAALVMGALWWIAGAAVPSWRAAGAQLPQTAASAMRISGPVLWLMSAASAALAAIATVDDADHRWAIGAGLLLASLLLTLFMRPAWRSVTSPSAPEDSAPEHSAAALTRWSRLHILRSVLHSLGVVFYIMAAH